MSVTTSIFILSSCDNSSNSGLEIIGEAQGTSYSIIIADKDAILAKSEIDSILDLFDIALSTYKENSVITRINNSEESIEVSDASGYFKRCYLLSQLVFEKTDGYFDPSVYPLVAGWGFMDGTKSPLSQNSVDSILNYVSFEQNKHHAIKFVGNNIKMRKHNPLFKMDFNAVAQGLSVDVLDELLTEKGFKNYYIEIGGEIIVRGKNREGEAWRIGIDSPVVDEKSRELENIITISGKAVATSGNYRKFYEVDGIKYAHTINPKTGFPVKHSLLSATVVMDNCAEADAYATAFMVLGKDSTLKFVEQFNGNMEVYLLSSADDGRIVRDMSLGFSDYLNK